MSDRNKKRKKNVTLEFIWENSGEIGKLSVGKYWYCYGNFELRKLVISVHKNIPSVICGKKWQFAS